MVTEARVAGDLAALSEPRRLAIAGLVRHILATEQELAALYAGFASRTPLPPLGAALAELAQAKAAQVAALEPLASTLAAVRPGNGRPSAGPGTEPDARRRGEEFSRAFRGERTLEVAYRELLALLEDAGVAARVAGLAADAARQQARLRQLYLQYS